MSENNAYQLSPEEKGTISAYTRKAEGFVTPPSWYMDFWEEQIKEFTSYTKGSEILSLGCGTTYEQPYFNQLGFSYTGIDITHEMLIMAQFRANGAKIAQMDMCQLGFPHMHFDGVWLFDSANHIPKAKMPILLNSVNRVLKDSGAFYIRLRTEGEWETFSEQEGIESSWIPEKFAQELKNANFEIKAENSLNEIQTVFIATPSK
jgi:SAM-dependent methyltransferase